MMFTPKQRQALLNALLMFALPVLPAAGQDTVVQMNTNAGNIKIQLFDSITPKTVANFLSYVNSGAYDNTIFHRSVPGFIVQGGGYDWNATANYPVAISTLGTVVNEFKKSNLRGTIAMAKLGGDPNSASDQWFFNLADNAANLDNQNGGFTVFGQVIDNTMGVVDLIASLQVANICASSDPNCAFTNVPVIPYKNSDELVTVFNASINHPLIYGQSNKLAAVSSSFTSTKTGKLHGLTLTNPRDAAVSVKLIKNNTIILVAVAPANSSLTVPLKSGLNLSNADTLYITLPTASDYPTAPLYVSFDAQ